MSEINDIPDDAESLSRAKLVSETAKIKWQELQRFFAGGRVVFVSTELDLVEAAYQVSIDNAKQIAMWQADGKFGSVSDGLAIEWLEKDMLVWSVVVKPWVLVQAI